MALRQPLPVDASTQSASTKALAEGDEPHREGPAVELEHEHLAAVAHNARELGHRRTLIAEVVEGVGHHDRVEPVIGQWHRLGGAPDCRHTFAHRHVRHQVGGRVEHGHARFELHREEPRQVSGAASNIEHLAALRHRRAQPSGDGRGVIGGEPVAVAPHPGGGPVEEAHVTLLG